jgi:hypothetical protein
MDRINMENLIENLQQDINKLVRPLKQNNDELIEVLKRRLTKKQWKYYKFKIQNLDDNSIAQELDCDINRLEEIKKQTILKLNQEKIKYELME